MRRRQMMQKVSRISLCVVIGLLFLALIWKFAGAQLAKKGIVLSNDTAAKTVSETAPEAEDGSGNAGIKKLAETTPPNETLHRFFLQTPLQCRTANQIQNR